MIDFKLLHEECETKLRSGEASGVAKALQPIRANQFPRKWALPFANIARRAGLFTLGLKILSPVIYPSKNHGGDNSTDQERAEYAVLLQKIGAVEESWLLLSKIKVAAVPEAGLYRAFYHFHRWDSAAAIPELQDYLQTPLQPYAKIVGQLNLALAFVSSGRLEESLALIAEIQVAALAGNFGRILANAFELRAQAYIQLHNFPEARLALKKAGEILKAENTPDAFFIRKWTAIIESLENGTTESLDRLRAEAEKSQDWESVRECDFQRLRIQFDDKIFRKLYFGTPYQAYRERMTAEFKFTPMNASYIHGQGVKTVFEAKAGSIDGVEKIEPGSKAHQLINVLLRDIYRPLRVGGIFAELFKGEHYDVHSSNNRVQQTITRARRQLAENLPWLSIVEAEGYYSLKCENGFGILLDQVPQSRGGKEISLERLKAGFAEKGDFNSAQGAEYLGVSLATFKRLANWAILNGELEKFGAGPATQYSFARIKKASPSGLASST